MGAKVIDSIDKVGGEVNGGYKLLKSIVADSDECLSMLLVRTVVQCGGCRLLSWNIVGSRP